MTWFLVILSYTFVFAFTYLVTRWIFWNARKRRALKESVRLNKLLEK